MTKIISTIFFIVSLIQSSSVIKIIPLLIFARKTSYSSNVLILIFFSLFIFLYQIILLIDSSYLFFDSIVYLSVPIGIILFMSTSYQQHAVIEKYLYIFFKLYILATSLLHFLAFFFPDNIFLIIKLLSVPGSYYYHGNHLILYFPFILSLTFAYFIFIERNDYLYSFLVFFVLFNSGAYGAILSIFLAYTLNVFNFSVVKFLLYFAPLFFLLLVSEFHDTIYSLSVLTIDTRIGHLLGMISDLTLSNFILGSGVGSPFISFSKGEMINFEMGNFSFIRMFGYPYYLFIAWFFINFIKPLSSDIRKSFYAFYFVSWINPIFISLFLAYLLSFYNYKSLYCRTESYVR